MLWPFTIEINCSVDFNFFAKSRPSALKFFSITGTVFSHRRSKHFWKENTKSYIWIWLKCTIWNSNLSIRNNKVRQASHEKAYHFIYEFSWKLFSKWYVMICFIKTGSNNFFLKSAIISSLPETLITNSKLCIPSTLNIDLIFWHTQWIVALVKY